MSIQTVKRGDVGVIFSDTLNATGLTNLNDVHKILFLMTNVSSDETWSGLATIVSSAARTVEYVVQDGDLDTAGRYRQEWEVEFNDGAIETHSSGGYNTVLVLADLNAPDS